MQQLAELTSSTPSQAPAGPSSSTSPASSQPAAPPDPKKLSAVVAGCAKALSKGFDSKLGGFGAAAPKFPRPSEINLLLRAAAQAVRWLQAWQRVCMCVSFCWVYSGRLHELVRLLTCLLAYLPAHCGCDRQVMVALTTAFCPHQSVHASPHEAGLLPGWSACCSLWVCRHRWQ